MAEQTYDKELKLNCVKQNDGNRKNYKSKFSPPPNPNRLINKRKSLRILFAGLIFYNCCEFCFFVLLKKEGKL